MTYNINNFADFKAALEGTETIVDITLTGSLEIDDNIDIIDGKTAIVTSGSGGPFTIKHGAVSHNFTVHQTACLTITNVIIDGANIGTNPFLSINGGLIINDSIIQNHAKGAIFVSGGTAAASLRLENTRVINNGSNIPGGAVYCSSAIAKIGLCEFEKNLGGGAVYAEESLLIIDTSTFKENTADSVNTRGGAIYFKAQGKSLEIFSGIFINNSANEGGAIYVDGQPSAPVLLNEASVFEGNTAAGDGGAIYINYESLNKLYATTPTRFSSNKAQQGFMIDPADIPLHESNIYTKDFTKPFKYGYNNYDIRYTEGTPLTKPNVEFPCIDFTEPGVYNYTIKETTPSSGGWTTDTRSYPVVITVTDDEQGNLTYDVSYPEGQPKFVNTYAASSVCVVLYANKTAVGADLVDGRFEFGVFDKNGVQVAAAKNFGQG